MKKNDQVIVELLKKFCWKKGRKHSSSQTETCDLSIASTKTKYINLNTKTQNIFVV